MEKNDGRKTNVEHWDSAWKIPVRAKLPSLLNVDILNQVRLLKKFVYPNSRYLEIGCAPGKLLAYVASSLKADASGLDYSESGMESCKQLFDALHLKIPLYKADLFHHELEPGTYDVVTSFGLIEHFDDPRHAVNRHVELVRPGGVVLISIPNYSGIWGKIQKWCDSSNLSLHNLKIMTPDNLKMLVDERLRANCKAYYYGSVSSWLLSLRKKMPGFLAILIHLVINFLGLIQPLEINKLAPMLVLEIRKG